MRPSSSKLSFNFRKVEIERPFANRRRAAVSPTRAVSQSNRVTGRESLDLNLPEVKLNFDEDGRMIGAHEVEHDESHQMIEEFMLAANIAVATS